ncbi:MAG TPA: RluA family pseudouridine synthase [Acidobacteriota bacterium]|nr:RluA family pseudouridine synthase [Acidobacteriota bacterium]
MVDQGAVVDSASWAVPPELESVRLDVFVRRCLPHFPRREIDKAIAEKLFSVNGRCAKKGERVVAGDRVAFSGPIHWLAAAPPPAAEIDIGVVYEDETILVLNKPAGMATHGFSARDQSTLANFLSAHWPQIVHVGKSRWEPGLVHRLDIETSGLLLIAKKQTAYNRLREQFRRREVKKIYWALVWGDTDANGQIEFPLAHDRRDKRRMRVVTQTHGARGARVWQALTRYRKLGAAKGASLLEIDMATGVTHQIRAHLAAIGHPIVGDGVYGPERKEAFGLTRHFLHAKGLQFSHPDNGRVIKLDAELPQELCTVLKRLAVDF